MWCKGTAYSHLFVLSHSCGNTMHHFWCVCGNCRTWLSLSAYIQFSDSALSTLISAEHSDQCWTDLSGPSLSPFPANLAGERGKLTLISADQNMWGRVKTSVNGKDSWWVHFGVAMLLPLLEFMYNLMYSSPRNRIYNPKFYLSRESSVCRSSSLDWKKVRNKLNPTAKDQTTVASCNLC